MGAAGPAGAGAIVLDGPDATEMLRELHELYGVDMSTLVRQSVKALYAEAKRRRGRR